MDRINGADTTDIGGGRRGFKDENIVAGVTGTEVTAAFLNGLQEEVLKVIEEATLVADPNDLTQLWQAIQLMIANAAANSFIYPHIQTATGKATITSPAVGEVFVDDFNAVWRGLVSYDFGDLFTDVERTFNTVANKTYHLKANRAGDGSWTMALKDLSDAGYNPGALLETDPTFDAGFDELFLARVVADGGNATTITSVTNCATGSSLSRIVAEKTTTQTHPTAWADLIAAGHVLDVTLDYSRTPQLWVSGNNVDATSGGEAMVGNDIFDISRYGFRGFCSGYHYVNGPDSYISGTIKVEGII